MKVGDHVTVTPKIQQIKQTHRNGGQHPYTAYLLEDGHWYFESEITVVETTPPKNRKKAGKR